jgi:outer membrane receptor for ferrienterochelin and colicin
MWYLCIFSSWDSVRVSSRFFVLVVVFSLQFFATASAREPVKIGVMKFVAITDMDPKTIETMSNMLVEEIGGLGNVRVIGEAELRSMISLERQKQLAECEWKCPAAAIGRKLPVRWVVAGQVGRFGNLYLLNLKLYDMRAADVPSRVVRKIKGGDSKLLKAIPDATRKLFKKAAHRLQLVQTVTIASRRLQLLEESPSAVSVYTREDIRSSGATDLADFLRRVPGFDIYRMKPSWPLVGARAMTGMPNNLVLPIIDGREALYEFTGFTMWNALTIDIEEVERVEVIRGPGSALYGANAFAGVISITTVSHQAENRGDVFLTAGDVGQHRLFGRIRDTIDLGEGILSYGAGLGFEEKASPSDIRDYVLGNAIRSHGYLSYKNGGEMTLSLSAGVTHCDGLFFHNVGDWRFTDGLYFWSMAQGDFALGSQTQLKLQVYHSRMGTELFYRTRLSAYNIWIADTPDNNVLSHNLDGKIQLDWQIVGNLVFIAGANIRYTTVDWEKIFLSPYNEVRGASFVQFQWRPLEELQLTGGLRLDLNTLTDTALSPRIVAVFLPWKRHSFRLGYGLAFRKPSAYETKCHVVIENFNPATPEIVEKAKTQIGNENLMNEKVHSFEAGWRANFFDDRLRASIDLFFNLYRDNISFVIDIPYHLGLPDILNSTVSFENQGVGMNAVGGEAELSWQVHDNWSLWCNFGLRHVTDEDTGERMPSEPTFRMNLGGRYAPEAGLSADVALHYVSAYKMPLIDPESVLDNPELIRLGEELLMVGRLGYRLTMGEDKMLEVGLNVVTPLGSHFREYPGAPIPQWNRLRHMSDWGGEVLTRLVSLYLRGSI